MTSSPQYVGYRFGSFFLDLECEALQAPDGKEIRLRPKSFALLLLMIENSGRLLSQQAIMDALWPNIFVTENNVAQCIHDLRDAMGSEAHQLVRTRPRRGYMFTRNVTAVLPGQAVGSNRPRCGVLGNPLIGKEPEPSH